MSSRICASQNDVDDLLAKIKINPCPHCKRVGSLIRHGFLRGYDQNNYLNKSIRAARVFCSNRRVARWSQAAGCGRTFSVWIANKIKQLFLSANDLWKFLNGAAHSGNKQQVFRDLKSGLSDSAAYHIWRRFINAQTAIRTALASLCEPPQIDSDCPAKLTLAHLQKAFQEHPLVAQLGGPIAVFAVVLQRFFI